eukprot:TRINITY_DN398_c0_g1_i9.p2 TRINITY_DN398_c0_g1~~TRINITY_DN398_c0_g1_i9.p2  ORF type:complete len:141 (-),score=56.48 TRINITY_DN398_c0_g1_i9:56-478(-)
MHRFKGLSQLVERSEVELPFENKEETHKVLLIKITLSMKELDKTHPGYYPPVPENEVKDYVPKPQFHQGYYRRPYFRREYRGYYPMQRPMRKRAPFRDFVDKENRPQQKVEKTAAKGYSEPSSKATQKKTTTVASSCVTV